MGALDPALRPSLENLPRNGPKVFRFIDRRDRKEEHEIEPHALSETIRWLATKAGVALTFHKLRKGLGCRYAGKVSAHVLQRLMRHSSIRTTTDYYVNIDAAVEEAVVTPGVTPTQERAASGSNRIDATPDRNERNGN